MRKPKKALDIYRLAISTIFILVPTVQLVALYSIIMIKLKKQVHPGEQSANAEEQSTRRNRNVLNKMAIAFVLFFFFAGPPTSLTSWYLFVCSRVLHVPVVQIYTLISAPFLSPHVVWSTQSLAPFLAAIIAELLRDFWISLELGKFNCRQETYNCECSGFLLQ